MESVSKNVGHREGSKNKLMVFEDDVEELTARRLFSVSNEQPRSEELWRRNDSGRRRDGRRFIRWRSRQRHFACSVFVLVDEDKQHMSASGHRFEILPLPLGREAHRNVFLQAEQLAAYRAYEWRKPFFEDIPPAVQRRNSERAFRHVASIRKQSAFLHA